MIKLKYPIFTFKKNDKMIYVFYREKDSKTTNTEIFKKSGYPGSTIIDSSGMKYVIKKAYKTKWRGIGGFILHGQMSKNLRRKWINALLSKSSLGY